MADDVTKRMNYFDHQFLRVSDFQVEQSYHLDRRRRHNRLLHTWGIAEGLTLTAPNNAPGVTVQPGTAIDGAGREIVLPSVSSALDLSGHRNKVVYVTIEYDEAETDPNGDAGTTGNTRKTETPLIAISETPPQQQDQQLILGRVLLDRDSRSTGTIDDGDGQNRRRLAGAVTGDLRANSLTLLSAGLASDSSPRFHADDSGNVHLSTAFGPLKIQGNLTVMDNVGIGTTAPPKARLEVDGEVLISGNANVTMGRSLLLMGRTDGSQGRRGEVTASIGFVTGSGPNAQISYRAGQGFELFARPSDSPDLTYTGDTATYCDLKVGALTTGVVHTVLIDATGTTTLAGLTGNELATFNKGLTVKGSTIVDGLTGNEPATFAKGLTVKGTTTVAELTCSDVATVAKNLAVTGKVLVGGANPDTPYPIDVAGDGRMRVRQGTKNGTAGIMLFQTAPNTDRAFVGMLNDNVVGFWSPLAGVGWALAMDVTKGRVRVGPDPTNQAIKTAWESSDIGSLYVHSNLYVGGSATKVDGGSTWATPSDRTLKKNVKPVDDALDTLTRLRGVTFEWKAPEDHGDRTSRQLGLIAQEVETVFPDWVVDDSAGRKLLNMVGFEALAIEACKELKSQLETERARNEDLEARLQALEQQVMGR